MSAIVNLRHEPKLRDAFEHAHVLDNTVLVDRRTKWGNPFRISRGQNAEQAVARYRVHLWQRIRAGAVALEELAALDNMWLACWCLGRHPCHAEVLARAAAWASDKLAERDAPHAHGGPVMSAIAFRRIAPDEIPQSVAMADHVGDVYALDDPLREGARYFVVHLDEDPRGPCRVHDRNRIREVTARLVESQSVMEVRRCVRRFRRLRQAHCNYYRTILGDPLRPVQGDPSGPGSPLQSPLRADPAAIPVASARVRGLRASLAGQAGRMRELAFRRMTYCATRARSTNPSSRRGSSARAPAATRNETALARLVPARRATVAQAQPPPGSFLTRLR